MTSDVNDRLAVPAGVPGRATRVNRLLPTPSQPVIDLRAHLIRHGPLPYRGGPGRLIDDVRLSGLTGRGGAALPVHRKLSAVLAAGGRPVAVANGAEREPASAKDQSLLLLAPHLVLDGLQLAAEAVNAAEAVLYAGLDQPAVDWLASLAAQRAGTGMDRTPVRVVRAPRRNLAGPEPALASQLSAGPAWPACTAPGVFDRGLTGRPALVHNVETLAHLSLLARYGPVWFARVGTPDEPGTMVCTIRQADGRVDLTELAIGTPLARALDLTSASAVLVGGYHGAWLPGQVAAQVTLANSALAPHGAMLGAGVLAALPARSCGLAETARVVRYLALEPAGQCGDGLPRIAAGLTRLANVAGRPPEAAIVGDLKRWSDLADRHGTCAHLDGPARFVASALRTFGLEVALHLAGRCTAPGHAPFLPAGGGPMTEADWN
jgi:NADH:ubiquinone oxidoreductase subunit F (NADH-binding)